MSRGFKGCKICHHSFFGGFPTNKQVTHYKGRTVEDIRVRLKCRYCGNYISTKFDLKECKVVYNPKTKKYEATHSVRCYKCGNSNENVTIILSREKGWSIS